MSRQTPGGSWTVTFTAPRLCLTSPLLLSLPACRSSCPKRSEWTGRWRCRTRRLRPAQCPRNCRTLRRTGWTQWPGGRSDARQHNSVTDVELRSSPTGACCSGARAAWRWSPESSCTSSSRRSHMHGGYFLMQVKDTGRVATVIVSGLPQKADHDLIVEALTIFRDRNKP
ncbi:hypothetical protein E5206_14235 [Arthrobacter sp. PAMC25564]|nr:hypothetical protein E5206_14235 [Arthrobacter sp. PAMC25564]